MLGGPIPIKFYQITSFEMYLFSSFNKIPDSQRFPEVPRNSTNSIVFQAYCEPWPISQFGSNGRSPGRGNSFATSCLPVLVAVSSRVPACTSRAHSMFRSPIIDLITARLQNATAVGLDFLLQPVHSRFLQPYSAAIGAGLCFTASNLRLFGVGDCSCTSSSSMFTSSSTSSLPLDSSRLSPI